MSSESKENASQRKKEFRCSLCRVTCLTDLSFLAHNRGAKHLKNLRSYRGREYDQNTPRKLTSLKDFINDPDRDEPLIGLQYVEEGRKIKNKRHYRCTLCEQDMAMQVMFDHLIGHKHRRSYLNKHFPLLIKGVQTPTVAVLKTLAKEVEEEEGLQTYATNVPIKLQPHTAKKHSQNSSEQFSSQSDLLEPMLVDANDDPDNMETVLTSGSLLAPWQPVPVYVESEDNSSHSSKHDRRSKSSSRERDNSSRRHRDRSPSRHKKSESSSRRRSSHEREHSSKRHKKRSSSREADHSSRRNRDRSPRHRDRSSSREADYKSKKDRNRSPRRYQKRSTSRETDHASRKERDYSPPQYKKRSTSREIEHSSRRDRDYSPPQSRKPESSEKYSSSRESDSKRHRDSSPHHKSATQSGSRDRKEKNVEYLSVSHAKYTEEPNPEKTYDSASHSSSGYSKDYDDSARKLDSDRRSGSSYNKTEKPVKTSDSSSHSSTGYSKVTETQGNSGVQSSQSTTSAALASLSPDILKILQGKDVPTVTSILNRLSQYYPPLQNVDISLLVNVLFESGALK